MTRHPTKILGDIYIHDIIRFFHGDGPACQLEAGQQKGGDFPCWICPVDINKSYDVPYVYYQPIMGIKERISKVLYTNSSKMKAKLKHVHMFSNLKKHEIEIELEGRNVVFSEEENTLELKQKLRNEIHGIQRLPTLFFSEPETTTEELLLNAYEILPCEPLHDVKGHLNNLYEEIVYHAENKEEKILLQNTIGHVMGDKSCKRGVDYRVSLIQLVVMLRNKVNEQIFDLLDTMCEIQEILYTGENKRSVETILRMYNQTFLHIMLVKNVIKRNPLSPKISAKKFYGKYLHALIAHGPLMVRIVSGKSTNTEQEERTFNTIKTTTSSTSNFHPDHVILNAIIRLQVKEDFNAAYKYNSESMVSKFSKSLPKKIRSTIPYWIIEKFPREWQAHLETISDYILEKGLWWEETPAGIVFNDVSKNNATNLVPPHYRTWSLKAERRNLESCWEKCLQNYSVIPATIVYTDSNRLSLNNLSYVQKHSEQFCGYW